MSMTDTERKALLEKLEASTKAARSMPSEEARRRLIDEGFCDKSGRLSTRYGGRIAARA
jgi:hypothetical protein